jgi:DNA topoisomerase-3
MRTYVESLATRLGLKPPRGYTRSSEVCHEFLDRHAPKQSEVGTRAGDAAPGPSAAQLAFAERIARDKDITVPDDAKASARSLSAWIDANTGKTGQQSAARKGRSRRSEAPRRTQARRSPGEEPAAAPAGTALKIPFRNKEVALRLGARYSAAGWVAPPGTDLGPFRDRGWL